MKSSEHTTWWASEEAKAFKEKVRELIYFRVPEAEIFFPGEDMKKVRNTWDGETLAPFVTYRVGYLHDVTHLLLSSTDRMDNVNWGLGADPCEASYSPANPPIVSLDAAEKEEIFTCTLQLALATWLGCNALLIKAESEFLNTHFPSETELATVKAYRPEALSDTNWDLVEKARSAFEVSCK